MIDGSLAAFLDGLFGVDAGWSVVGGHAANVYRRESRFTMDVDLLVALGSQSMGDVAAAFIAHDWTVKSMDSRRLAVARIARGVRPSGRHRFGNAPTRKKHCVDHGSLNSVMDDPPPVLSPEDVIVHKLIADRAKDDADIEDILQADLALDWDYLDRWIDAWELRGRFERIIQRMRTNDV